MDSRIPFKENQILQLGEFSCHISRILGMGSNAIVYGGWYPDALEPDERHEVLIKELYPCHPRGGIRRQPDGSLEIGPGAEGFYARHRTSFEIGNEIHLRLLREHPDLLGANLNSYQANNTLYSLLGCSGGRTLEEALAEKPGDLRSWTQVLLQVLDALEAFHSSGYLHLDISPDNIMLVGRGSRQRAFLIDFNSARPLQGEEPEYMSCKPGYSAPEVETGEGETLDFSSDLYSVAAVFYRCLMGRSMTLEERLQARAPDGSGSPLLEQIPQTAVSLVGQILRKGLNILPRRRYRSIGQMRSAFQELLDRIDCLGVTRWSLWESGRRTVEALIGANPSLHYLREEAGLYPIRVKIGDRTLVLTEYLDRLLGEGGRSGLLLARGGMGKTTLLLHAALRGGNRYTPSSPAVLYLSLSGWRSGQTDYIRRQILAGLRFRSDMNTWSGALHALDQLLQEPMVTERGSRPVLLLLLDGLNEVQGDPSPLLEEIRSLDGLQGVRILGASRTGLKQLDLEEIRLSGLHTEDIRSALGQQGLLLPESPGMLELLRTPLVLSIYIRTARAGKQLEVDTQEDLIRAYLDSLYEKEVSPLPDNSPERWQLQTAMDYVLPAIAVRDRGLTERELLNVAEECRKTIRSRVMLRAFPQWIGHSRDILGNTDTAEQWMGLMVYSLLWHRLGLLVQFPDGTYQVFHQNVRDYLGQQGEQLQERLRKLRWLRGGEAGRIPGPVSALVQKITLSRPYDETLTVTVLDSLVSAYGAYGQRLDAMEQRLSLLSEGNTREFLSRAHLDLTRKDWSDRIFLDSRSLQRYHSNLEKLCSSGFRVSWSRQPMDRESASRLLTEAGERTEAYRLCLEQMIFWAGSPRGQAAAGSFPQALEALLDADARLLSKLYFRSCAVHFEKADPFLREKYEKAFPSFSWSGREPEETLKSLSDARDRAEKAALESSTVLQQMMKAEEKMEKSRK